MMNKKVMIAIDDSVNASGAIQYAARMADVIPNLHVALLNVQPALSQYLTDEAVRRHKARAELERVLQRNDAKAHEVLDNAVQRLTRNGFEDGRISKMTIPRDTGVANDILTAAQAGSCDAILVGRRGVSYVRQWVMGSVTASLVEHSKVIPIWIMDGEVASSDILLAIDGSSASLRALDHMAFMLSGQDTPRIRALHVRPRFQDYCEINFDDDMEKSAEELLLDDDQKCMDDFYPNALSVLEKNGLAPNSFELETLTGNVSVSRTILRYARDRKFGSVVMGRRGRSNNMFTGSVSRSLLNRASDTALWLVP